MLSWKVKDNWCQFAQVCGIQWDSPGTQTRSNSSSIWLKGIWWGITGKRSTIERPSNCCIQLDISGAQKVPLVTQTSLVMRLEAYFALPSSLAHGAIPCILHFFSISSPMLKYLMPENQNCTWRYLLDQLHREVVVYWSLHLFLQDVSEPDLLVITSNFSWPWSPKPQIMQAWRCSFPRACSWNQLQLVSTNPCHKP